MRNFSVPVSRHILMTNSEFKNKAARYISTIFIPPLFSLLVYVYFPIVFIASFPLRLAAIFNGVGCSVVLPLWLFFLFRRKKLISDDDALIKEQRLIPFLFGVGFYAAGLVVFLLLKVPEVIIYLWISNIIITSAIIIINLFWKISVHAAGVGTFLGVMYYLFGLPSLFLVILVLLISWARIYLKCHSPLQVLAGTLLGFSAVYFLLISIK